MLITTITTYTFDPVREYEAMLSFEMSIDMKDGHWQKSESTASISYTYTERVVMTLPELRGEDGGIIKK